MLIELVKHITNTNPKITNMNKHTNINIIGYDQDPKSKLWIRVRFGMKPNFVFVWGGKIEHVGVYYFWFLTSGGEGSSARKRSGGSKRGGARERRGEGAERSVRAELRTSEQSEARERSGANKWSERA